MIANSSIRNLTRSFVQNQSRLMSSGNPVSTTFISAPKKYSFKKAWLNDPSTYPLIVVLGAAAGLCSGFGIYFLTTSKDVQINPQRRNSIMRTWGAEK